MLAPNFNVSLKLFYSACVLFSFISFTYGIERKISCSIIPSSNSSSVQVIHVTAVGPEDAVHFLWSTYRLPSVIVAKTSKNTNVTVNVTKLESFQENAITFSSKPLASIGFIISELIQLSYKDDTAAITDVSNETRLGLDTFNWNIITHEDLHCSEKSAFLTLKSSSSNDVFYKNGTFQLQISIAGNEEPSKNFPHLIYTGNSTLVEIIMDNFYSDSPRTRYSLEVVMLSSFPNSCNASKCQSFSSKSISDEFSPGIFSDIDILPQCVPEDYDKGSFITWRPVSYTSKEPSVANSSDAVVISDCNSTASVATESIAAVYFSGLQSYTTNTFGLAFGTVGDGFYPKTLYNSWSLMIGTGVAVHPTLSVGAIIFISVGLGALAIFFLSGGIYFLVQWFRKKDDDLLLSESYVN